MFGAGGGTSSYKEVEDTDVIVLWGSNARETHPIFFHHVLQAQRRGAELFVVDPRRTVDGALGRLPGSAADVGTDIALANTVAREIIHAGLGEPQTSSSGPPAASRSSPPRSSRGRSSGAERRPACPPTPSASWPTPTPGADRAQMCWTLGITEHHNAVDNVLALINLALLCGHVGRYGSGLNPLRGQNNVQGGGDMGAIPNRLPGFQDILDPEARARFDAAWGCAIPPGLRHAPHRRCSRPWSRASCAALYVLGENPAQSEADVGHALKLLEGLDHLVVQDIFLTKTAEMADVVLPPARRGARRKAR